MPIHIHTLAYGTDPLQFAELYIPMSAGPYPVVMLIHGGFWRAAYGLDLMRALANDLAQRGIAAWNVEYRRIGDPGGGWPGTLQDIAQAVDYLPAIASAYIKRVVPIGHSAGGHLALWLAARHKLSAENPLATPTAPLPLVGAISLAGVLDLVQARQLKLGNNAVEELLGGSPDKVPQRYAATSLAALLPLGITQVLIHGTVDDRVPLIISRSYAQRAAGTGDLIILIELPDVDHFALIDPASPAWGSTVQALLQLLS